MKRFNRKGLLFALLLLVFSPGIASCSEDKASIVTSIVYEADLSDEASEQRIAYAMDALIATIGRRLDAYGIAGATIQREGQKQILVQIPDSINVREVKALIEKTGFLEFREVEMNPAGQPVFLSHYLEAADRTDFFDAAVEGKRIFGQVIPGEEEDTIISFPYFLQKDDEGLKYVDEAGNPVDIDVETLENDEKYAYSWMPAKGTITEEVDGVEQQVDKQLTGAYLTEAQPRYPTTEGLAHGQEIDIAIAWDSDGTKLFDQIMKRIRDKGDYGTPQRSLGMFLDSELISSPQVYPPGMEGQEYGSEASITGDFTREEARLLAIQFNSGALPIPLKKPPLYEYESVD